MAAPLVLSINVGLPRKIELENGKSMSSGIIKTPVCEKNYLDADGFQGDGCQETRIHGGRDKAVCGYFTAHYPFWESELSRKLGFGAFGENLSISVLDEKSIHIGDVYGLGSAKIQCTQPRQPCSKLNKIFGLKEMACKMQTKGYSGSYFRVIQPGWAEPGGKLELLEKGNENFSVETANQLMHGDKTKDWDMMRKIIQYPPLSNDWRMCFQKKLEKAGIT